MKKETLGERVARLEKELAELKAAPRGETHIHYHYPRMRWTYPYPNPHRTGDYWWYSSTPGTSAGSDFTSFSDRPREYLPGLNN